MGFHLMPPVGLMGAPRLFCQDPTGLYHVFFDYWPQWPHAGKKVWGHYSTPNLVLWKFLGRATLDDIPEGTHPCKLSGLRASTPLDQGFGFSDPAFCVDHEGRTLTLGLLSEPETRCNMPRKSRQWAHCLTFPRELTRSEDGQLIQQPVSEISILHTLKVPISPHAGALFGEHRCDIQLEGITGSRLHMCLDNDLEFLWADGQACLRFLQPIPPGCHEGEACIPLPELNDLRLLVDSSAFELYLNGGRIVLSTRWFPRAATMICYLDCTCASSRAWAMADGLDGTYPAWSSSPIGSTNLR